MLSSVETVAKAETQTLKPEHYLLQYTTMQAMHNNVGNIGTG